MPIPKIDKETCISCGLCPALAAFTFKMEDGEKAEVYNATGDDEATIQMAIDSCPTQSISWEE